MQRTTFLIFVCVAIAVLLPLAGMYYKTQVTGKSGVISSQGSTSTDTGSKKVWLTTPPFSIANNDNGDDLYIAALSLEDNIRANDLCPWMPLVRDQIQTIVGELVRQGRSEDMALFLEQRRIHAALKRVLAHNPPEEVVLLSVKKSPAASLDDGRPVQCDGNSLNHKRSPLFFN